MTFPSFKMRLTSDPETMEVVTAPDLSAEDEQRLMHLLTHAPALYEALQDLTIALETGSDVEKIHALAVGLTVVKRATWDKTTYQKRIEEEHLSWEEKRAKAEEEADREYQAQLVKDDERRKAAADELTQLSQVMGLYDPPDLTKEDLERHREETMDDVKNDQPVYSQEDFDRAKENGLVEFKGAITGRYTHTQFPSLGPVGFSQHAVATSQEPDLIISDEAMPLKSRRFTATEAMTLKPGDRINITTDHDVGGELILTKHDMATVDSDTPEDDFDDPPEEP